MGKVTLPTPYEQLAGCVWLPRIIAKARQITLGELPQEYVARFGQPDGADGQFLEFFSLTAADIIRAAKWSDAEIIAWFKALPSAQGNRIDLWNHVAVNLGRPGFPMAQRLPVALATKYSHLAGRNIDTIYAMLAADEESPPTSPAAT